MLKVRATELEFLDATDCDPQLAFWSYRFMRLVNRFAGGTRAVKNFLAKEISRCARNQSTRVLDIGSGTCDIPLAITDWARRQSKRIEFTCIETNKTALTIAAENIRRSGCDSIELKNENFLEFEPHQRFDYAVGSMFFHHFQDDQIVQIIERLRSYVLRGVLINDLRRNSISYTSCFFLVCVLPTGVRHDALLSIRKGFKTNELYQLLSRVENAEVSVEILNLSRLIAVVRFDHGVR